MEKGLFRVSPMFSDHMVLQRDKPVVIWGEAPEDAAVTVMIDNTHMETTAKNGTWKVRLAPMPAGGPYRMTVSCGEQSVMFQDVMIGEVWFAGGQSNMELELQNCDNAQEELKHANYQGIRFYNVVKTGKLTDEVMKQQLRSQWRICQSDAVRDVSAVAYFAARKLHQELGVAIGVIDCYIGGTSATCWMDRDTLMSTPETRGYVEAYDASIAGKTQEQYEAELAQFQRAWEERDAATQREKQKNPDISAEELNACLGPAPWPPPAGPTSEYRPGNPYQAMMERVIPYTVKGFWYYQGEEDTYKAESYGVLMKCLIELWRRKWEDESAPFIIHQLPMFIESGAVDDRCWAVLREQQMLTARQMPNTYLTVLIDCGELDNIHPTDKQTVGWRLALQCLGHVYGLAQHVDSPSVQTVRREGQTVIVAFDCEQLSVRGEKITLFELAGEDGQYHPADAGIHSPNEVAVVCQEVPLPVAVRYAWTNYGIVTLYGNNELPVVLHCKQYLVIYKGSGYE